MSRSRNADEFLLQLRQIGKRYDDVFSKRVTAARQKYADGADRDASEQLLEAHVRAFALNAVLAALNWRLDTAPDHESPNLIPEAPIRSEERSTVRFLDYLGLENETDDPLLIVETKRPSAVLPSAAQPAPTYSEVISRGLIDGALLGEWNEWLRTLRDYVVSTNAHARRPVRRVVITNGDWFIVFLDPTDAFMPGGKRDASRILVFQSRADLESRYCDLFACMEHGRVLGESPPVTLADLRFHIDGDSVDRALHGLRIRYEEQRHVYGNEPVIRIAVVVFLRSRFGSWLRIEVPPQEEQLPADEDRLEGHLETIAQQAQALLDNINRALGTSLRATSLRRHYEDEDAFAALPGVTEPGRNDYIVVTGDKTHYVLPKPSVTECPYHDWNEAHVRGAASIPGPITSRSVEPRSFFKSGEVHHCGHRDVSVAKLTAITAANRARCGPRSGNDGQAFCEVWRIDQHLCCRTCAFEDVCTAAPVFRLPCRRPDPRPAG